MKEFLDHTIIPFGEQGGLTVSRVLFILLYSIGLYILYRWIKRLTRISVKSGRLQQGQYYSVVQISKYVLVTVFFILSLLALKVEMKYFIALTPLLVGLGLGLQQVFNDLFSGFILLVEPSIRVNDIVEVDTVVARVKELGLRTSKVETRDGIFLIIPNHKLVSEKLINWSSNHHVTRFSVKVGVAYGSDLDLIKKILIEVAWKHQRIKTNPAPFVRLIDFGSSSIDFELFFWSNYLFPIEDVQSDLRFMINEEFKNNDVHIPFPQRDLHLITDNTKA